MFPSNSMMYSGGQGRGTGQDGLGTGEGPRAPRTSAQLCTNPDPLAAVSRASGRFPPWSVGHRGACRSLPLMSLLWASPASHVSRTLLLCLSDKRRLSGGSGTSNQREGGPGEKGTMSRVRGVAFVRRPVPQALGRPPLVPLLDEPCAPHSRATSVPSRFRSQWGPGWSCGEGHRTPALEGAGVARTPQDRNRKVQPGPSAQHRYTRASEVRSHQGDSKGSLGPNPTECPLPDVCSDPKTCFQSEDTFLL